MKIKANLTGGRTYADNPISEIQVLLKYDYKDYGAAYCFNDTVSDTSCLVCRFDDIDDFKLFVKRLQDMADSFEEYLNRKDQGIEVKTL